MHTLLFCLLATIALSSAATRSKRQYGYYPRYSYPSYSVPVPQVLHVGYGAPAHPAFTGSAVCVLKSATDSKVVGEIVLNQPASVGPVQLSGTILNLTPGRHGFHIHEHGNTTDDCKDAGPHFNPGNANHGAPDDKVRHAGDLGNIEADAHGVARFSILDTEISLVKGNPRNVLDRAIVVHAKEDDLGKGNDEESLKTGNAGMRLACCVIEQPAYYKK